MTPSELASFSAVIALATVIGSGIGAYVAVKVAIGEVKRDIMSIRERLDGHEKRIDRAENILFDSGPHGGLKKN